MGWRLGRIGGCRGLLGCCRWSPCRLWELCLRGLGGPEGRGCRGLWERGAGNGTSRVNLLHGISPLEGFGMGEVILDCIVGGVGFR